MRSFKDPPAPLRVFGVTAMTVLFLVAVTTKPEPGLHGDGPWVILGLVMYLAGIWMSIPARDLTAARRARKPGAAGVRRSRASVVSCAPRSGGGDGSEQAV